MTTRPDGDYTGLARDYARYRPAYAPEIPSALLRLAAPASPRRLDVVDVGAGTGIWTRMLAVHGCRTVAVEPNAAMREHGIRATADLAIDWRAGSAEDTGLADACCDLATMASSFHWTDFDRATRELARITRPGGVVAVLWNTREIDASPLLARIEAELERRLPGLERVSSGRSAHCERLAERLATCGRFTDVRYLEAHHVERMSPERYLGIWRSVRDVRAQAGERTFAEFLAWVEHETRDLELIEATYRTRTWTCRR